MKVPRSPVVAYGIAATFVMVPVGIAVAVAGLSEGRLEIGRPAPYLWFLAVVMSVIGISLLSRESRWRTRRSGRPPRPGTLHSAAWLEMFAYACFVIAELCLVIAIDWRVGAAFLGPALAWALFWTPRSNRKVVMRAAIEVRCTPAAAFDLVSDPNNWHLYLPNIELAQPIQPPLHVGSLIHVRMRRHGVVSLEGEEEVVALEPGRRFGTAVRDTPDPSTGIYEFEEVAGRTKIEYTYRSAVSLPAAILGGSLRRKDMVERMYDRRAQMMDRIKLLMEEADPTSV
jgi:hypothetical protein